MQEFPDDINVSKVVAGPDFKRTKVCDIECNKCPPPEMPKHVLFDKVTIPPLDPLSIPELKKCKTEYERGDQFVPKHKHIDEHVACKLQVDNVKRLKKVGRIYMVPTVVYTNEWVDDQVYSCDKHSSKVEQTSSMNLSEFADELKLPTHIHREGAISNTPKDEKRATAL